MKFDTEFMIAIKNICIEAGNAIMPFFPADMDAGVTRKEDGSPVTLADPASEVIIIAGLNALTPDIPVIAEEQAEADLSPQMTSKNTFWLVDPLDGTKEFIKGSKDFCINIGLVDKGTPIFGVMYCPATGDFYHGGIAVDGAFLNNKPIATRSYNDGDGLIIVGTENYKNNKKLNEYLGENIVTGHVTRGCTLKFCLIIEGKADFYARFVPTYEWDIAAAHAMLLAVGGDMIDFQTKRRLAYGKDNYLNGSIVTASNDVLDNFGI